MKKALISLGILTSLISLHKQSLAADVYDGRPVELYAGAVVNTTAPVAQPEKPGEDEILRARRRCEQGKASWMKTAPKFLRENYDLVQYSGYISPRYEITRWEVLGPKEIMTTWHFSCHGYLRRKPK